jgi:membrane protease YdiL (CAAX protease family)
LRVVFGPFGGLAELRFVSWAWLHQSVHPAMPWDFWLIFLFLSIVLPWRGRERMRHFLARSEVSGRERIRLYVSTILFQWLLATMVAWRAVARGLTVPQLGLANGPMGSTVLLTLIGATLIAAAHWMNLRRLAASNHPAAERLRAMAARLFPRSATETVFFTILAVTAGICEEFIFRGFVIAALFGAGLSNWTAVIVSSLMFGAAHLYQGKGGSASTGLLGILFASVRIAYHSIFPVVIWHAVLDVVAGIAGARYFATRTAGEADLNSVDRNLLL